MKVFIINLEQDIARKLSIQNQLEAVNLDAEFITAVYGKELSDEQLHKICPYFDKTSLTLGEIGCAMSHLNVYKRMIDDNIPTSLVLEDDAKLGCQLPRVLRALESVGISEEPIVFLLSKSNEYFDSFKKPLINEYQIFNVIDAALAHGYVINQAAAKKLYHFLMPIRFAADEWKLFREHGIVKLKGVIPPVIGLTNMYLNSSIGDDRTYQLTKLDQGNRKRPFFSEIKLFLWRIFIRAWLRKAKP